MRIAMVRSLEPDLFRLSGNGAWVLIGSRCKKCQRVFFPKRLWCASCLEPACEEIELGREGKLLSFSIIERASSYALVKPPYVLGEVLLDNGLHIYTTIAIRSEADSQGNICLKSDINSQNIDILKVGQRVELAPVIVEKDAEGNDIFAYNFNPVVNL